MSKKRKQLEEETEIAMRKMCLESGLPKFQWRWTFAHPNISEEFFLKETLFLTTMNSILSADFFTIRISSTDRKCSYDLDRDHPLIYCPAYFNPIFWLKVVTGKKTRTLMWLTRGCVKSGFSFRSQNECRHYRFLLRGNERIHWKVPFEMIQTVSSFTVFLR